MSSWWQAPYAGGGPAKVKGFPRPLYPPAGENHGKQPSRSGPDVVAYKRTISRLGRWPWQAFDDHFSDRFSLGNPSSSVADSGVAGVQRQQHIDATGWIGKATFNALCYALVPDDPAFPHAGEQAMDGQAVSLLNQAFEMFEGHEPASSSGTVRAGALARAIGELGYRESPSGSNQNKFGSWYGANGQPWCAMFVTWAYEQAGPSPTFVKGSRYAFCPYVVADARAGKNGVRTTDDPEPGDLVVYDWAYDGEYDHIGLFEKWTGGGGNFQAIEGNTSTSSNSNGGEVMRRSRSRSGQATIFVRVKEPA